MADANRFQHRSGLEVAVIGMAGRFPGARSVGELWRNLRAGLESITFFTDEELAAAGVDPALRRDPRYVPAKGYLADAELFDADFFSIGAREAEILDPQHRHFLECAWEAIESGGYDLERYPGWVGVYAGATMSSYFLAHLLTRPELLSALGYLQVALANDKDYLATRTSYKLNLEGPSLNVQTACSTSLVAVHLACQALLRGECDMALAGGASIGVPLKAGYLYQEGGILSPDGHCRAFDADARGCVGGNGVAVVLLKRLDEALAEGDVIHAVIKGSALNNDGALKIGYTAPRIDGQAKVIRAAHIIADIPAESITYVEAHGTATELGDPAEIAALTQAFSHGTAKRGFCAIGSVKSNLGHLDAAAGATGLIKTALALEHREIPPSLHFRRPGPQIDFAETPFYVNAELRPWPAADTPRRAGVSSFGIGGTNAHAILEEAPPRPPSGPSRHWQLLLLSARTAPALQRAESDLAAHLEGAPDTLLSDVAYTLQVGRKGFSRRRMVLCRDAGEATAALARREQEETGVLAPDGTPPPIAFLLPGQGAQQVGMAADLYRAEPAFRQSLDHCADLLRPFLGLDFRQILYPARGREEAAAARLRQTVLAQPVLFAVEYAMARLWEEWGIQPQALLGHSLGEFVAACLAGALRLEDALRAVARRGALMQSLPPGAMLSVPLAEAAIASRLGTGLDLAAVNGEASCVVSGPVEAVEALREELAREGIAARLLETSHAFHSAAMDAVWDRFVAEMAQLDLRAPQIPYLSNVTGTWILPEQATDPAYWGEHLRGTVRFAAGLAELLATPERVLLEVGPWGGLAPLARRHPRRDARTALVTSAPSPKESTAGDAHLLRALGRLWLAGARPDWKGFYRHERRRRVSLPTYPFERRRYWVEAAPAGTQLVSAPGRRTEPADWFYVPGWKRALPRATAEEPRRGPWLLFLDGPGLGRSLAEQLARRGEAVTTVTAGERFARLGDGAYVIDPSRREDYAILLQELCGSGRAPAQIVHLWVVDVGEAAPEPALREKGFASLILLAQALGEQMLAGALGETALTLTVVSDSLHEVTGEEALCPGKATLLGPVQVIPQEYPNVRCRNLDLLLPARNGDSWERSATRLADELSFPDPSPLVCLRGLERWVPVFDPLRLEKPAAGAGLRPGGCYLITGGLAGIGLEVARGLARTVGARLALTGRTPLPPRAEWERRIADGDPLAPRLRKLLEIEALAGEPLVLQADAGDLEAMRRALDATEARFGPLHGVFHAAGLPGGTLIQRQSPEIAGAVLAAKVEGTLLLDRLLEGREMGLLVLFSSQRAFLGGAGQVDYCAANCFLEAFARARSRRGRPTLSIAWDGWRETGMAYDLAMRAGREVEDLSDGLSNAEGWEALSRILAVRGLPQVVVSPQDFAGRLEQSQQSRAGAVLAAALAEPRQAGVHPRPPLATPFVAPRNPAERTLAEVWSHLLGVEPIGVDDNFFELGGDSVVSLQIVSKAHRAGLRLTPRQVFQHQTIAALAAVAGTGGGVRARQDLVTGEVPLTPIQHWFFAHYVSEPHYYNQAVLLSCGERLDAGLLEWAVGRLLEHHDALRLRFERTPAGWRQVSSPPGGPAVLSRIDLSALPAGEQPAAVTAITAWLQGSLDLTLGPLSRMALLELGGGRPQRLAWIIHHLAVDVVSWRILLQDLQTLYSAAREGRAASLPAKTTSYQEWAERLRDHGRSDELLAEAEHWLGQPWQQVSPLPLDFPGGLNTWASARTETLVLDPGATRALVRDVPSAVRAQTNDLLLTALAQAFRVWTGEPLLLVDFEGHGREAIFDEVDLSRTVGWLTNIYPLLLQTPGGSASPGEDLQGVKEQLRRVPGHGFGYGLLRALSTGAAAESFARLPRAEVIFLYTGRAEEGGSASPYAPAPEPLAPGQSPRSPRRHLLDVTIDLAGDRLRVHWTYSRNLWAPATIRALSGHYEAALRELIRHCLGAGASALAPADFPLAEISEEELLDLRERLAGGMAIEDLCALSPVQEGLLFHTLYQPGSGVYVTDVHWTFRGDLDPAVLRRAWEHVVERHTALRTLFAWERLRRPLQVVLRAVELPWAEHDWRALERREQSLEALLRAERARGFDVAQAPLMRLHLLRLGEDVHTLVWTFHHLLIDGWAVHLIFAEVIACYAAFRRGLAPALPAGRPYRDYIAWLRRQDMARAEAFWRRILGGFSRPVPLPGAAERPAGEAPSEGRRVRRSLALPPETGAALLALGRGHQLTLNSLLQGAWGLLLASYAGGQRDVVFGAVTAGRPDSLSGVESMVGLFINTLPVRLRIEPAIPLIPWLRQLQEQQAEMREFEYSPLVEVHGWAQAPRGTPLFETILAFESFPSLGGQAIEGLGLEILSAGGADQTSYPVTVTVYPRQEIVLEIATDSRWFDEATVEARLEELTGLLARMAARPGDSLGELLQWLDSARRLARARAAEQRKAENLAKLRSLRPGVAKVESGGTRR